jgi:hypothetical protein
MEPKRRRMTGTVTRAHVAQGSKSEHLGVVLRTATGEEFVLRRRGGNAFRDEALDRLVGATITGVGLATDGTFIMDEFSVKEDPRR